MPEPAYKRPVTTLLATVRNMDDVTLFRSRQGEAYIKRPLANGVHEIIALRSDAFHDWLAHLYAADFFFPPPEAAIREAIRMLEAEARFEPAGLRPVHLRIATSDDSILLDLTNDRCEIVEISRDGYHVKPNSDRHFRRIPGMLPIPAPSDPDEASLAPLENLHNLAAPADFTRIACWLTAAFHSGSSPILILKGPPGSGKSTAARMLRSIIDPNSGPLLPRPIREQDLQSLAWRNYVLAFDHITRLSPNISDALCRLSSGGAFVLREPYQREPRPLTLERPIVITTPTDENFEGWQPRPDLAARALTVELKSIEPGRRRPEADLWSDFEAARPRILAALCLAASTALSRVEAIQLDSAPRFADFARWSVAAAPAFRKSEDEILDALMQVPDPIVREIDTLVRKSPWTGTAAELHRALPRTPNSPATPKGLIQHLKGQAKALEFLDIEHVTARTASSRRLILRKKFRQKTPRCVIREPAFTDGAANPGRGGPGFSLCCGSAIPGCRRFSSRRPRTGTNLPRPPPHESAGEAVSVKDNSQ